MVLIKINFRTKHKNFGNKVNQYNKNIFKNKQAKKNKKNSQKQFLK